MIFTKTHRKHGGYITKVVSAKSGRVFGVQVYKTEVGNPSARGGAYRTEWVAKFGDRRGSGDTRTQAVDAIIRSWANDGITVTPQEEQS